jgi:hypothetical protein
MRKTWERPKLLVLTRGKQEEFVLSFCKEGTGEGNVASNADNLRCLAEWHACGNGCAATGGS